MECSYLLKFMRLSIVWVSIIFYGHYFFLFTAATPSGNANSYAIGPTVNDTSLKVEPIFAGSGSPSSMAFLGPDDILVLDKYKGKVQRIVNGEMLEEPLLDVNVNARNERGMLGIAVANNDNNDDDVRNKPTYVFLYYTQVEGDDVEHNATKDLIGNRLYRYELDNNSNKLENPKLLFDLAAFPSPRHNGGAIIVGPDDNVYVPVGEVNDNLGEAQYQDVKTLSLNVKDGKDPDGRAGILRITQDGQTVNGKGIVGDGHPLDMYYAYGIRNSFGLDFDPVTGKLWDTENGPSFGDEINLVEPGFNSGWKKVQGLWHIDVLEDRTKDGDLFRGSDDDLVNFNGKGIYSSPEFTWRETVGVTAIKFLSSDRLGKEYENDLFVGDYNNGNLYHFDLDKNRTGLVLDQPLDDKLADSAEQLGGIIFARGFGSITDIEVNPYDGHLYILSVPRDQASSYNCTDRETSYNRDCSAIFRIIQDTDKE